MYHTEQLYQMSLCNMNYQNHYHMERYSILIMYWYYTAGIPFHITVIIIMTIGIITVCTISII